MVMVVGVGFLHSAKLGILLAIVHYITAAITGIFMRLFHKTDQTFDETIQTELVPAGSIWKNAISTMRLAYLHDGRTFGKLLGDSVLSSVQSLMLIGGYMMIFSVLINVLTITHLTELLRPLTASLLGFMNIHTDTAPFWIKGIMEIHLGAYAWSQAQELALLPQMALLSAFLGWGGLSAHAQVAGFQQNTGARYSFFLQSRLVHAVLALLFTILLWKPLQFLLRDTEPSFLWLDTDPNVNAMLPSLWNNGSLWGIGTISLIPFLLCITVMLTISILLRGSGKKSL